MNYESRRVLNSFVPREYQKPLCDALENKGYKKIVAIWPRRCLAVDTDILMENGSVKKIQDVKTGDRILSFNGKKISVDTVKDCWKTGKKKTFSLKSSSFLPIETTEDHLFAVKYKNSIGWKKACNLSNQNKIYQYAGIPGNINCTLKAELLGLLTHNGYISGYQQPIFTNVNIDILKRAEFLIKKVFNYDVIWRKKGNGFDLGISNGTKGGGYTKNKVKEFFRNVGLDVPKSKKRIHPEVFNYDEESILRYLAGVISADGSIHTHKKDRKFNDINGRERNILASSEITIHCGLSKQLAYDTYWLLRKIGIISQELKLERNSNWKVRISQGPQIFKLLSNGRIYGKETKQQEALLNSKRFNKKRTIEAGCYNSAAIKKYNHTFTETYDIETKSNHNFFANGYLVHNSGKDITVWNLCVRQCIKKVCIVYYIFPTYAQAKKVIWDSITNDGKTFHDFIPDELIKSKNSQELKITFTNGSILQLIGSENYNSLVGTNPYGCVFSEYAIQDPRAYQFLRPILSANDGWCIFVSTPRGRNSFYELYQIALNHPDWFAHKLTLNDTKHIPLIEIERERAEGLMSEDLIQQEFYTSFSLGVEGAYYTKYLDKMRLNNQIGQVPYEPGFKVHTAWDLGVRDSTTIIFFQTVGQTIRIIDCYEKSKEGLEHYAKILNQKDYIYGKHIAPHDIGVKEFGSGMTRLEKAKQLGIQFTIAPSISIEDGIESVRSTLPKMWIDEQKCEKLLKSLNNYRQEFDNKKRVYKPRPLHDWSSHFCFDGNMNVTTPDGNIKIKNIKEGQYILTPLGKRKVLKVHKKLTNEMCNINNNIICTPDHNIFTQDLLTSADSLSYNDTLEPYSKIRSFLWKKIFGYYIGERGIKGFKKTILSLKMKNKSCLMDTFIDGMRQNIIWDDQEEKIMEHHIPEKVDIQHILKKGFILFAVKSLSVINMLSKKHVVKSVELYNLDTPKEVYDLTVEHDNCYYINGYLVSNCDAMRYLSISLPSTKDGLSATDLDRIRNEAIYGVESNLPPFFR